MPKNNSHAIVKTKTKSESTARKPLRDVSNAIKVSAKSTATKISKAYQEQEQSAQVGNKNEALDRLLLIHSDLSSLIHQIDELVVQALNLTSRKSAKEVESFSNVLSEMHNSLKLWIPRFQTALLDLPSGPEDLLEQSMAVGEAAPVNNNLNYVESPEQTTMDSLVSPSPLVSWRADCNIERGRQLFLLTPLPRPKELSLEYDEKSKSVFKHVISRRSIQPPTVFDIAAEANDNLLEDISVKPTPCKISDCNLGSKRVSPENASKNHSFMLVMTPCLKVSPPKSCVLLEPISEFTRKAGPAVYRSTPFPVGLDVSEGPKDSESSGSQESQHTSMTYPDFLGIKLGKTYVGRRKAVEESPNWLMSPPKTCILMEPPDDKTLINAPSDEPLLKVASIVHKEKTLKSEKENDVQGDHFTEIASCMMVESTPLLKEPESTVQRGKQPGENTLKKELWMKFEAASTNGIPLNVFFLPKSSQKGFLDRLDEVS